MKKEELQKLKVVSLVAICKERSIPHYRGKNVLKKDELVEAILGAENVEDNKSKESAKDKIEVDGQEVVEVVDKAEKETANSEVDMEQKMPYIESAQVGMIVAVRLPNGKVKSAKIAKKSTKNRRFMLETDYGAQYIVSYDDIVWVRTGKRWPRGVYKLLKGLVDDEKAS